jgi:hypothetical protein
MRATLTTVWKFAMLVCRSILGLIPGIEPGFTLVNYPTEIEAEVDTIYKQMYDD